MSLLKMECTHFSKEDDEEEEVKVQDRTMNGLSMLVQTQNFCNLHRNMRRKKVFKIIKVQIFCIFSTPHEVEKYSPIFQSQLKTNKAIVQ